MRGYELWDLSSQNLLGDFDTENEALEAVSAALSEASAAHLEHLSLVRVGPRGSLTLIATGRALAHRAAREAKRGMAPQG